MKIHRFVLLATLLTTSAFAQTNTFPSTGNVGIGTTSPQQTLAVNGYIDAQGFLPITNFLIRTNPNDSQTFQTQGSLGKWVFTNNDGGGFLGIGTTNPGSKLEVSAVDPIISIHNTNDTSGAFIGDTYGVTQIGRYNRSGAAYGVIGAGQFRSMLGVDANGRIGTLTNNFGNPAWRNILDDGNGNVGIGTTSPANRLVISNGPSARSQMTISDTNSCSIMLRAGASLPSVLASDVGLQFRTGANWTDADAGGVTTMALTTSGNVGIGTTNPTHKLAVNGTIKAKEVIVETNWSDYVFADDYALAPLAEVEAHIKANKHLPGIPSAAQVADHGISVGDMQARLLAKIEELTLHLIAQEKRLVALEAENARLQASR